MAGERSLSPHSCDVMSRWYCLNLLRIVRQGGGHRTHSNRFELDGAISALALVSNCC